MHLSVFDRIFWFRVGLATLVGVGVDYVFGTDWQPGVLFAAIVFIGSAYIVRWVWGKRIKPEQTNKIYTTAVGTYIMIFLFVWILCFTVGLHSLNL